MKLLDSFESLVLIEDNLRTAYIELMFGYFKDPCVAPQSSAIVKIGDTEGTEEIEEKLKELAIDSMQSDDAKSPGHY